MKRLILLTVLLTSSLAFAKKKDLDNDMEALGGNQDLMERANAIDPRNTVRVIQKRAVDLDNRLEIGINYGMVAGGDPYVDTNNFGGRLDFHFSPHWAVGGRYYHSANSLNSQGTHQFDIYNQFSGAGATRPNINYAQNTWLGTVAFSPFYGKINFADLAITQFDIYFLGGAGQIMLEQGTQLAYTGGIGFAFWWNNHWSTHFEGRYQGYRDQFNDTTTRQMNLTIFTLDIGYLF